VTAAGVHSTVRERKGLREGSRVNRGRSPSMGKRRRTGRKEATVSFKGGCRGAQGFGTNEGVRGKKDTQNCFENLGKHIVRGKYRLTPERY